MYYYKPSSAVLLGELVSFPLCCFVVEGIAFSIFMQSISCLFMRFDYSEALLAGFVISSFDEMLVQLTSKLFSEQFLAP